MKKIIKLCLLAIMMVFFLACNSNQQAVDYNNTMVVQQNKLISSFLELANGIEQMDSLSAQQKRASIGSEINKTLVEVGKMKFDGNDYGLQKQLIALMRFYQRVINVDYKQVIALYYVPTLNDVQTEQMLGIVNKFSDEEKVLDESFKKAQEAFAKAYNFKIADNPLQDEIDKLN